MNTSSSSSACGPQRAAPLSRPWLWLAGLVCALMLLTVALSAFIRLAQSGQVCSQWLDCAPPLGSAAPALRAEALVPLARQAHRVVATVLLALALVLALGLAATRQQLGSPRPARLGLGVLGLGLALAALGIVGRNSSAPAIMLGNLLGGLLMLTVCWQLVLALRPAGAAGPAQPAAAARWHRNAGAALLMLWLQVASGGWLGVGALAQLPATTAWAALHPLGCWALLVLFLALTWTAWQHRRPRRIALGLLGLLTLQGLLGLTLTPPALLPALAHNLISAFMLLLLTGLRAKP